MSGEGILPLFFPLHPGCLDLGKIVPRRTRRPQVTFLQTSLPGMPPAAPRGSHSLWVNEYLGSRPSVQHLPAASLRCIPQTQAERAGKLREKKEEGEKCSVLSTPRGCGAPGAGERCASPGRAGEGGCLPAGRGAGRAYCGRPAGWRPAGSAPAAPIRPQVGAPYSRSLRTAPPHPSRVYFLGFLGGEKVLVFCLSKKKKKILGVFGPLVLSPLFFSPGSLVLHELMAPDSVIK